MQIKKLHKKDGDFKNKQIKKRKKDVNKLLNFYNKFQIHVF